MDKIVIGLRRRSYVTCLHENIDDNPEGFSALDANIKITGLYDSPILNDPSCCNSCGWSL